MVLNQQEEALINVVRGLPPDEADKVLVWANQLADLARGGEIDWSDSWSDQDRADAVAASVRRLEEEERENN
jgi:hypothetical protein